MKITILGVEMEASYKVLYATPEISKEYIQAMKDTNGKIITEEEFMKDIGHGVVGGGKRDWKEKLWYRIEQKHLSLDNENYDELFEVVESLLEEQRKEVYAGSVRIKACR